MSNSLNASNELWPKFCARREVTKAPSPKVDDLASTRVSDIDSKVDSMFCKQSQSSYPSRYHQTIESVKEFQNSFRLQSVSVSYGGMCGSLCQTKSE